MVLELAGNYEEICGKWCKCRNIGRRKEPLVETAKMLEEIIKEKQSNASIKIFDGVDVSDEKAVTDMFDA
ncbi:MAG: hypothetical protein CM1200mP23_4680 [Nitrososphaerota archaeon]|nr:MAG: hypothetical protein CM1200mP23_4680 [Nitrososphaerota archaeon]